MIFWKHTYQPYQFYMNIFNGVFMFYVKMIPLRPTEAHIAQTRKNKVRTDDHTKGSSSTGLRKKTYFQWQTGIGIFPVEL